MNEIIAALSRLIGQVIFWAMVEPWEQAIRVRAGKHVKRLHPGFHLRIPILDVIYKQSTRWRTSMIATQTLSTSDGHTLVVSGTLGYVITDIEKLYQKLHHSEDTIVQIAASEIASEVFRTDRQHLFPTVVNENVTELLGQKFTEYGIGEVQLRVTDFAFVRAFRLMSEGRWLTGRPLSTEVHNV